MYKYLLIFLSFGFIYAECNESWVSDGDCDDSNNNEECNYDGGDCCPTECADDVANDCPDNPNGCYSNCSNGTCCGNCNTCIDPMSLDSFWGECYDGGIDCQGENYIQVLDNVEFAQISESDNCFKFIFISEAFNMLGNYSISVGDYVYIYANGVYGDLLVDNISESSNFIQISLLKNVYDNSSICIDESYTLVNSQSNIFLMEIPNYPDICGVCEGPGIPEGNCDCNENATVDCAGECNGNAAVDYCGVCEGGNADMDCTGECFGDALIDECGECEGEGPQENYDCDGNCIVAFDCNNDCGGTALIDDCGFCSGGNTSLEYNGYLDCEGVCFGDAVEDECMVCNGDGFSCAMIGDINDDNILDILDIILMLNIILDGSTYNYLADLNEDENIDILDIVLMVNWILYGVPEPSICDGLTEVELWGECYNIATTTSIYKQSQGLTGSIPPEIGNLTNLNHLDLSLNQLTGEIPPEIGSLTYLTYLYLNDNNLTGEIPQEIGNLTNLEWFSLQNNQLTGEIPQEIGNLTNLEWFSLQNNQLTGEIPPEVCDLIESNNIFVWWITDGNNLINTCE